MPWLDTLADVHRVPVMSPRSSNFSNTIVGARSAAGKAGPSAPLPCPRKMTWRRAPSWREEWRRRLSRTRCWM